MTLSQRRFPLITVFGLGHLPASGTFGSVPPVALAAILIAIGATPFGDGAALYHATIIVFALVFAGACITQGDIAEVRFRKKDPGECVADEVAGQAIPLLFLPITPATSATQAAMLLIAAFLAFRAFDIAKFWPMSALQGIRGGWGILLDDLVAGLLALATVQIAAAVFL